ncbi:unnamed protein product [Acanthoscelides obtectus]|uniref:Tetraspanin n=1 Tax=Acanthoscelides obtectus TaxID=200917 RepID=A0A9P0PH13_ACAOB|nr:unnamed protein product [Acanthoscelides obtectus]CAK1669194.1 hypothetical protein AOBTE_LOCUS26863 [Acanthoscelides obtectus]
MYKRTDILTKICEQGITKWLLELMNIILICIGVTCVILGGRSLNEKSSYNSGVGDIGCLFKKPKLLHIYAILLIVLAVAQFSNAFVTMNQHGDFNVTRGALTEKVEKYKDCNNKNFVDQVQRDNKCCGIDGPNDWANLNQSLPFSCRDKKNNVYAEGCLYLFHELLRKNSVIFGIFYCVIGTMMTLAVIAACCLACSFRKQDKMREEFEYQEAY